MPDLPRIPIGEWARQFINLLRRELSAVFDVIGAVLDTLIGWLATVLLWPHPLLFALLAGLLGLWLRGWRFGLFSSLSFLLIESMGFWVSTMQTLALVLVATLLAVIIGVPTGILAARSRGMSASVRPVLDLMQTLPAFVYLIPAVMLFSIGTVPGLIATLVFAIPPGVRLTELGIRQVDPEVVEAARAFGASRNQVLTRVQIPLAMPTIMQGVNQVIMLALSMVVIAGMIGAGGLGEDVFRGITRLQIGLGVESGLAVVIIAIFLDRITSFMRDRALDLD
ncbi:MAG TPA: ABC transporter permease subunit [Egibacteraceae bacterium]|nr:ABC transporter permease subunit [Egibacteraceae bacterium]